MFSLLHFANISIEQGLSFHNVSSEMKDVFLYIFFLGILKTYLEPQIHSTWQACPSYSDPILSAVSALLIHDDDQPF